MAIQSRIRRAPRPAPVSTDSGVLAYHRGRFVDAARLTVPALDRGFQFGDGVYEALRTYGRVPFRMQSHLARLRRSVAALGITLELTDAALTGVITTGVRRVDATEVAVRLLITRGVSALAYHLPAVPHPELYAFFQPLPERPASTLERGVSVMTLVEEKAERFANVKLMNGAPSILALASARRSGCYEVLRVSSDGRLLEGFISNVCAVKADRLLTPPVSEGILDGVTRRVVLAVARDLGLSVEEAPLPLAHALACDELFLTHTSAGVVPVVAVDDRPIGTGRPGSVARRLAGWFDSLPADPRRVAGVNTQS